MNVHITDISLEVLQKTKKLGTAQTLKINETMKQIFIEKLIRHKMKKK